MYRSAASSACRRLVPLVLALCFPIHHAAADDVSTCAGSNHTDAIAACGRLLSSRHIKPRDLVRTYIDRAIAYRGKGDPARALVDIEKAINLDGNNAEGHNLRGIVLGDKGDYQI